MKRTPAKRSSLFLLELIIAILFFSLTSAVCVRIFVQAHLISRETQEENMALEKISGFTEVFLSGSPLTDLPGVTLADASDTTASSENISEDISGQAASSQPSGSGMASGTVYQIYYDSDWQICDASKASYQIQIQLEPQNTLQHGTFTALRLKTDSQSDSVIYSVATDFCPEPAKEATH